MGGQTAAQKVPESVSSGSTMHSIPGLAFLREVRTYAGRIGVFNREDWIAYILWVGLMVALFAVTLGFLVLGVLGGVSFPPYVWNVPLGVGIFTIAIAFDTIGHRTVYKEELLKAEALVHHVTICAGILSCVLLSMAFTYRQFLMVPALVFVFLSIFYSMIDEAMHWIRYAQQKSDRVEMWSHFGIFVGHMIFVISWSYWFLVGYPGVAETLSFIALTTGW
jgi:preprotein translocase subunit SecE